MRSKHLSVRKCIDKKPDKIKGIMCICIILAVVCAGNMIPNYLISLKAAKIAKTSTTISNADISPYSHSISAEERLTKMMSLMQDNVNELWNGKYSEKREPLDTEIPVGQAYTAIQTFLKGACELQKQSGIMQMLGEDDIVSSKALKVTIQRILTAKQNRHMKQLLGNMVQQLLWMIALTTQYQIIL